MNKQLTEADIKELKYQCRMGYILPFFFFVIGSYIVYAIINSLFHQINEDSNYSEIILVLIVMFLLSILLNYKMNGKFISDIRNNVKILKNKTIQYKESKIDVEAGSGTLNMGFKNNPMKEFIRYNLIIENTRYRVDKEIFDKCAKGDDVYFHIAPKSNYRLKIDLKKN